MKILELPVREVTLLEDRALVRRAGSLSLEAGLNRLRVEGVSPLAVDKTLYAKLSGAAAKDASLGQLKLLRTERVVERANRAEQDEQATTAPEAKDAREKLEAQLWASEQQLAELEAQRALLRSQFERLQDLAAMALTEISEEASWDRVETERWVEQERRFHEQSARLQQEALEAARAMQPLQEQQRDLGAQLQALGGPAAERSAALELTISADAACTLELSLGYLVPGACWRPAHRAQLLAGGGQATLNFETEACVWQNTGEAWREVQLNFSTERPSLGARPPLLSTDTLHTKKVGNEVVAETRSERVQTAGLGAGGTRSGEGLPGIDDGGEPRVMRAPAPATVVSDGRPYRVPLSKFSAPAHCELVLMAELAPAVILRSEQENLAAQPLLAGPVELIRQSGPVGRSSLKFIAPGERFELGFGPELALRVQRETRQLKQETKLLSSWTRHSERVNLRISNIGPVARRVRVRERIPVSELEKVKIELAPKACRPAAVSDKNGFVEWELQVPGFGQQEVKLGWAQTQHADVVA